MALKSIRFSLMDRLYRRYLLEPLPAEQTMPLSVSPIVVPVIQADQVLLDPVYDDTTEDITGGGFTVFFTVPANERWYLQWFFRSASSSNTKVSIDAVTAPNAQPVSRNGTTDERIDVRGMTMTTGDRILVDNDGATSSFSLLINYNREILNQ